MYEFYSEIEWTMKYLLIYSKAIYESTKVLKDHFVDLRQKSKCQEILKYEN